MSGNTEIMVKIREWQNCPYVHQMTCGNDSTHGLLEPVDRDGDVILICPDCDYEQDWIPDVVADTDVRDTHKRHEILRRKSKA